MKIDPDKCIACLECVDLCPMSCIAEKDECAEIDQDECVECGVCLHAGICPTEAIYQPPALQLQKEVLYARFHPVSRRR